MIIFMTFYNQYQTHLVQLTFEYYRLWTRLSVISKIHDLSPIIMVNIHSFHSKIFYNSHGFITCDRHAFQMATFLCASVSIYRL